MRTDHDHVTPPMTKGQHFTKEPEKIITAEEANRSKLRFQLKKLLQNYISTGIPFLRSTKPGTEHLYTNENKIIGHVRQRTGKITNTKPAHKRLQQLNHLLAQLNYLLYPNLETDLDLLQRSRLAPRLLDHAEDVDDLNLLARRMRAELRAHKRSASANSIPPKAKHYSSYLKGA